MNLDQAACRNNPAVDPDWFVPDNYHTLPNRQYRISAIDDALATCATCPLQQECLETYGEDEHAIVGGTTPAQRGIRVRYIDSRRLAPRHTIDQVAVDRVVGGDYDVKLYTPAEKAEVVRRMLRKGMSAAEIVKATKMSWTAYGTALTGRSAHSVSGLR